MSIAGSIVSFAVMWFLTLLCVMPFRVRTQSDVNEHIPGVPGGAPVDPMLRGKIIVTSIITVSLFALLQLAVYNRWLTFSMLDSWMSFR